MLLDLAAVRTHPKREAITSDDEDPGQQCHYQTTQARCAPLQLRTVPWLVQARRRLPCEAIQTQPQSCQLSTAGGDLIVPPVSTAASWRPVTMSRKYSLPSLHPTTTACIAVECQLINQWLGAVSLQRILGRKGSRSVVDESCEAEVALL